MKLPKRNIENLFSRFYSDMVIEVLALANLFVYSAYLTF